MIGIVFTCGGAKQVYKSLFFVGPVCSTGVQKTGANHFNLSPFYLHGPHAPNLLKFESTYTVCPKVAYNSFHMVFSAISGWILKPFDLQVATLGRFDMMYNMP